MLPHAIHNIIADYASKNKLLPWVDLGLGEVMFLWGPSSVAAKY